VWDQFGVKADAGERFVFENCGVLAIENIELLFCSIVAIFFDDFLAFLVVLFSRGDLLNSSKRAASIDPR
jgi:hypothetical protein